LDEKRTRHLIRYMGEFVPETMIRADGSWVETVDGRRIQQELRCAGERVNHKRLRRVLGSYELGLKRYLPRRSRPSAVAKLVAAAVGRPAQGSLLLGPGSFLDGL
jgi:hypothetical protein